MKKIKSKADGKTYLYRRIDTRTEKGLRTAERLQASGWVPLAGSLFDCVSMIKEVN